MKIFEIKFRAWGKNIKEFLSPDGYPYGLTLKEIQNIEDIDLWEFQQFTGLKDKNGKEIYEGDIVIDWSIIEEGNKEIIYYKNGFYYDDGLYSNWNAEDVEVIGNIYENPELINQPLT